MSSTIDESVNQFIAFTAADRDTALVFLQGAGNDPERAVDNYFTYDGNVARYKQDQANTQAANAWDESAFAADRDAGNLNAGALVPYNEPYGPQLAPSRPPSRSHGKGYVNESTDTWQQSHWDSRQGDDMSRAIHASLHDQTTGLTATSGWTSSGMGQSSREIVPDADAIHRRRQPGEPAFLKPLPNRDALPALLTIAHHIPLVRESLSFPGLCVSDYGHNPNWWRGESIAVPQIREYALGADEDTPTSASREDQVRIAEEIQRLLVFLQFTERSYGSANSLAELLDTPAEYFPPYNDVPPFEKALQQFDSLLEQVPDVTPLFTSYLSSKEEQDPAKSIPRWYFDATVHQNCKTLYSALDEALWGDLESSKSEPELYLRHLSPVAIIRARLPDPTIAERTISVPSVFFADRYKVENAESLQQSRKQMRELLHRVQEAERKIKIMTKFYVDPPGVECEVSQLIETTVQYASRAGQDPETARTNAQTVAHLRAVEARVNRRTQELREKQGRHQETIDRLASTYITDTQDAKELPQVSYTLRGVISMEPRRAHVVYFAARSPSNSAVEQWWKVSYDDRAHQPQLRVETVTLDEAVKFAGACDPEKILVYASAEALESEGEGDEDIGALHQQLRDFVVKDNASFRQEIEAASRPKTPLSPMQGVPADSVAGTAEWAQQLGKYDTHRRERRLSNDSTTVLGGNSPRGSIDMADSEMMSAEEEHLAFSSAGRQATSGNSTPSVPMPETSQASYAVQDADGDEPMQRP